MHKACLTHKNERKMEKVCSMGRTLFDKIWAAHAITTDDDGRTLLHVSRHLAHDGSWHAFEFLKQRGLTLRCPEQLFATPDHGVSTRSHRLDDITDADQIKVVRALDANSKAFGFTSFGLDDDRQGIIHVVGPEQGLTQPGLLIVCGDSHTSTHGALGALSFGIGASEVCHVLTTQTIWQRKPSSMRVLVHGQTALGVSAKDVVLAIIAQIGANGASGHVIEYAGPVIDQMSIEQRLTVCNMSIEAGAKAGLIAPDDRTFAYLKGKPYAPQGQYWDVALGAWRLLKSDADAVFDKEVFLDVSTLGPMVTWGNSPDQAVSVDQCVPQLDQFPSSQQRESILQTLRYMGLKPGEKLANLPIDIAFIGSCTNARIEDLRAAAQIAKLGKARVRALVVPGSTQVKLQAEAEGLADIFRQAGFEWRESGCSMCVGMNGDLAASGQRVASTTNRNFKGRQGVGSRTHLMSPTMVAAAALNGCITDVRQYL
jgi:3-isopropylmalate/(R)-2-methylmalate dehydratase large subunit